MVWRCFKYLSMLSIPALSPFVISSEAASPGPVPYAPAPYSSLLPDYEEAVKQTPPPSYRAATLMAVIDPNVVTVSTSGFFKAVPSKSTCMLHCEGNNT